MKSLQQNNLIKAPFDISWLLEKDILRISKILTSRGANLYAVGGSVRASYWKEEFDNIDFAINITPYEVKELLKNIRCTIIQTGIEYGTLSVIINKKLFEITSFRKDIETFGRKAIVKYTNCIKQDAKRRDFTFNAIYLNMKGEIVDPLGNFSDLAKGKVKFVGDPKKRILEDHLRILRFFRFLSKYPLQNKRVNFRTLKTINETKDLVKKLSKERIWREFKMILSSDGAGLALRFMNKTGVLKVLFPSFSLKRTINLIVLEEIFIKKIFKDVSCNNFEFKNPILRLSILLKNQQKPIQEVLSLNRNEIKMFNFYNKFEKYSKKFKSLGFNYGQKNGLSLLLLYIAKKKNFDIYIKSKKFEQKLLRYFGEITDGAKAMKNYPVNGNDLSKMGYSGKAIGSILERLKKTWIDSDFKLNKKQLLLKL